MGCNQTLLFTHTHTFLEQIVKFTLCMPKSTKLGTAELFETTKVEWKNIHWAQLKLRGWSSLSWRLYSDVELNGFELREPDGTEVATSGGCHGVDDFGPELSLIVRQGDAMCWAVLIEHRPVTAICSHRPVTKNNKKHCYCIRLFSRHISLGNTIQSFFVTVRKHSILSVSCQGVAHMPARSSR